MPDAGERESIGTRLVGAAALCTAHIVYKMFGDIVYTLPKGSAAGDAPGEEQLLIQIDLRHDEIAVTDGYHILLLR